MQSEQNKNLEKSIGILLDETKINNLLEKNIEILLHESYYYNELKKIISDIDNDDDKLCRNNNTCEIEILEKCITKQENIISRLKNLETNNSFTNKSTRLFIKTLIAENENNLNILIEIYFACKKLKLSHRDIATIKSDVDLYLLLKYKNRLSHYQKNLNKECPKSDHLYQAEYLNCQNINQLHLNNCIQNRILLNSVYNHIENEEERKLYKTESDNHDNAVKVFSNLYHKCFSN